jgi:L-aspartate oxidase
MIYKTCLEKGIDITKDYVPVRPVEHYLMGGIAVDLEGRTSMKGLYAVGETACNRVHGANRLASNSLLEGLVFGARVAQAVSLEKSLIQGTVLDQKTNNHPLYDDEALVLKGKLQTLLVDHAFIYRNKEDLENSLKEVQDLCKEYQESVAVSTLGVITLNLLTCALQIFTASASRKSSMGAHQLLKEN